MRDSSKLTGSFHPGSPRTQYWLWFIL